MVPSSTGQRTFAVFICISVFPVLIRRRLRRWLLLRGVRRLLILRWLLSGLVYRLSPETFVWHHIEIDVPSCTSSTWYEPITHSVRFNWWKSAGWWWHWSSQTAGVWGRGWLQKIIALVIKNRQSLKSIWSHHKKWPKLKINIKLTVSKIEAGKHLQNHKTLTRYVKYFFHKHDWHNLVQNLMAKLKFLLSQWIY